MSTILKALRKAEEEANRGILPPSPPPRRPEKGRGKSLLFLLVILGVLLGVYLGLHFRRRGRGAVQERARKEAVPPPAPAPPPVKPPPAPPPVAAAPEEKKEEGPPEFRIEGIMYSQEKPVALIEGRILQEGDKIRGVTVVKILPRAVQFSYKGVVYEISRE